MPLNVSFSAKMGKGDFLLPPRFSKQHVVRCCGCAAAAGSLCMAGFGRPRRPLSRRRGVAPRANTFSDFGAPQRRVTDSLLVFNAVMFAAQLLTKQGLTVAGAKSNVAIANGQWWRLITPAFLHGNLVHLAVNSLSLHNLGPILETVSGRPRFAIVYAAAAFSGCVASYYGCPTKLSLGASGAIFGIGGAVALFFYRHKTLFGSTSDHMLEGLRNSLLMNVVYGLSSRNIDNWAHLGGLVGGSLAAYLFGPNLMRVSIPGSKTQLVDAPPIKAFCHNTLKGQA
ncbi:hypothetical protein ABBQ38_007214 [Trebouxia sp. C0009 RCD-2024]